ncbi:hypothetical protein [Holdemania filiformis]|uniref:hypothetical protein n=1 Tax=Holdemania filiformis TaxID=61171 RepID=UPI00266F1296|nr:hypothetical protein [Holdemania filiformis]
MKKLFLLGLTLALIATIEGFQSSAQKQMMAEMPRLKWASAGYASACYEVQFTAGQQARQRERIAELIAVGQESEASEEDRLNARKLAVMEVKPDAESGLSFYYGGMKNPLHDLFPVSGTPQISFNQAQPVYYTADRKDLSAPHMTMIQSADVRVEPFYNSVEQSGTSAILWFFAEQPSDWIALIYQLRQEFPDMTFIKQPITVDSTVSDTLANQRSGQIIGIAAGITLAALALTLYEVRRQKKQTPAASALNILGRSCGMTGLIAVLEIPVLIILVNRLQGVAWNYYTNFLYTDLFHLYGWIAAGFGLCAAAGWLMARSGRHS